MSDRGSVLPLLAGYLAILLLSSFGTAAVISAESLGVRLQGIADAAVLAGHEAASHRGVPDPGALNQYVREFLATAPSVEGVRFTKVSVSVKGEISKVTLCAFWQDMLGVLDAKNAQVCRSAQAKSFAVL